MERGGSNFPLFRNCGCIPISFRSSARRSRLSAQIPRMINFSDFEKKIHITFKDKNLLKQAFTHRSYINENAGTSLSHNERLEFLGDAVLELVVTDFLYKKYPQYTEGELTALRSALVNAIIISEVASDLGMNDYLLLSKGEAKDHGKARQ